jgi:hypothetical protein
VEEGHDVLVCNRRLEGGHRVMVCDRQMCNNLGNQFVLLQVQPFQPEATGGAVLPGTPMENR